MVTTAIRRETVASTAYVPLTRAALGNIARGAAFAFRRASTELGYRRPFGAAFATSSVLAPVLPRHGRRRHRLRTHPPGIAEGDLLTSCY